MERERRNRVWVFVEAFIIMWSLRGNTWRIRSGRLAGERVKVNKCDNVYGGGGGGGVGGRH